MSTDPAIDTEAHWVAGLLQMSDSFFPTGSYAHSFGLEGLVQAGIVTDRASLRTFLHRSVLPGLRQTELPLVVHAWRSLGEPPDWRRLGEVSILADALKSAREARAASQAIGRQRAELLVALRDDPLARAYLRQVETERWPFASAVSAALEGRVIGSPLRAILTGVAYSNVAGVIAASMKLLRLGHLGAQSLLVETLRTVPDALAAAEAAPLDELGWFNPWLDIAAARHDGSDFRLFIS